MLSLLLLLWTTYISAQQYVEKYVYPQLSQFGAVQSYTLQIESDIDDENDLYIRTYWFFSGRRCLIPKITFSFEAIDYIEANQFIDIFQDNVFLSNITRCQVTDNQCNIIAICLKDYHLNIDTASNIEIGIVKSGGSHALCSYPTRSINANLTVTCGLLTAVDIDATKTIDLNEYNTLNPPNITYEYYTNRIRTLLGNGVWAFYDVSFTFLGNACYEPTVSLIFEDTDFKHDHEWLEIYTPDLVKINASRCSGILDMGCGSKVECLNNYQLYWPYTSDVFTKFSVVPIGILKSIGVHGVYCGTTLNATVTLRCSINEYIINKTINVYGNNKYILPLIQSTAFSDNDIRYHIDIKFVNGTCSDPQLTSFRFQETDFGNISSQWLEIYSSIRSPPYLWDSTSKHIICTGSGTHVVGNGVTHCDQWYQCINDLDLQYTSPINELHLGIIKSKDIKQLSCGYTLNAEITISCLGNPSQAPTVSPITNTEFLKVTLNPTYSASNQSSEIPTENVTTTTTSMDISQSIEKTQNTFDYLLILYGLCLILFGVGIAICIMAIYKKHKHRKEHDQKKNGETHNTMNNNEKLSNYKSLRSMERASSDDAQIDGEEELELELVGELPDSEDQLENDDDSIEGLFAEKEKDSSENLITSGNTPIGGVQGLPKLNLADAMNSVDEEKSVDSNFNNCQECGLRKTGNVDPNDEQFYCFDCWSEFDNQQITYI